MNCRNCKYWNTIAEDCVACSQIKEEYENIRLKNTKYGKTLPLPTIPVKQLTKNTSEEFMKNGFCKFYKRASIVKIFYNYGDYLVNGGRP